MSDISLLEGRIKSLELRVAELITKEDRVSPSGKLEGNLTLGYLANLDGIIELRGGTGYTRDIRICSGTSLRWILRVDSVAETGSNVGSDFEINPRADDGGSLGYALKIARASGNVCIGGNTCNYRLTVINDIDATPIMTVGRSASDRLGFRDDTTTYGYFSIYYYDGTQTNDLNIGASGSTKLLLVKPSVPSVQVHGRIETLNQIELSVLGSGNRYAYIDFHGDDTYSDYGLRIIRQNTGPNANSEIYHRGTGALKLTVSDGGYYSFNGGSGDNCRVLFNGDGSGSNQAVYLKLTDTDTNISWYIENRSVDANEFHIESYNGTTYRSPFQIHKNAPTGSLQIMSDGDLLTEDYQGYSPTVIGWSSPSTTARYKRFGKWVQVEVTISGTSNSSTTTMTLPMAANARNFTLYEPVRARDNGGSFAWGMVGIPSGTSTVTFYRTAGGATFTATGQKDIQAVIRYIAN